MTPSLVFLCVLQFEGCQPFSVSAADLHLSNSSYRGIYNAHLEVTASIKEIATGAHNFYECANSVQPFNG